MCEGVQHGGTSRKLTRSISDELQDIMLAGCLHDDKKHVVSMAASPLIAKHGYVSRLARAEKAKAKTKAKAKAKVLKKTKAAPKAKAKAKAALKAAPKAEPKAPTMKQTRKCITSRAYHGVYAAQIKAGKSILEAKAAAKEAYAEAARVYDIDHP